ncbi:MAG: hypothetical protein H6741_33635 [Alphaproteobacteria bacterium]|nr:hypothetical protein [Alphaproteobacteria bacterium]MCB9797659.1 hypothetical protein [Alphaproteobacteria bacterium]
MAIVCEGPSDREVIQAILDVYLDDYDTLAVQPPSGLMGGDSGPLGGGWRGVQSWCEQESHAAQGFQPLLSNANLLIIQVDADVAMDDEHDPNRPCPPVNARVDYVRDLLMTWLGHVHLPQEVLLCVPATASETWALVALHPTAAVIEACTTQAGPDCIECRVDIKALLRTLTKKRKPKLVVGQDGKLKNNAKGFAAAAPDITDGWPGVVAICGEARRFDTELQAALP